MAEFKKLTYVDGSLWFNGQLVATVSDEWIRGNIQTIKNILEVSSGGPGVAADVSYDNAISQILATNVQTAIDEIHEEIDDRAGACEGRLDVVEDNIEGLVDSINIEVIPEELGDTVGDAISSINDSLNVISIYNQITEKASGVEVSYAVKCGHNYQVNVVVPSGTTSGTKILKLPVTPPITTVIPIVGSNGTSYGFLSRDGSGYIVYWGITTTVATYASINFIL